MPNIVRHDGTITSDDWTVVPQPAEGESLELPKGPALIPAELWLAGREHFEGNPEIGVWLDSHEEPEILKDHLDKLPIIAINFPKFADGRGYSSARLLRERFGYRGELRAIGDVLLDQLQFMKRCGFDSYALRPDKDINKAPRCLQFFTNAYQAATDNDEPLFRRRGEFPVAVAEETA
ncbi:Uncharacterized conserved protein, DUF934 family [Marinobacter daqiaonensis]|uniref:Uncharacterized conserved protein, DUF934 family n=1 Tax=Marinobacter daqiaonensis TaxID=650891 RepID=A0A1I6GV69_9GAMM|nr:DUF934 domain-containing protein [Marinobacter daqiaonensis]SFR46036.1 Uncharacterized conserved protein, DUF934 family [Marinobacter daqiaonensis]